MPHRDGAFVKVLASLGSMMVFVLGLAACEEEAAIVVRPVELVDPVSEDPFDLDPLLAPRAGDSAHEQTVELAGGEVVTVRIGVESPLLLAAHDIAFVELAEAAIGEHAGAGPEPDSPPEASRARFAVYAVLGDEGRSAWSPFAAAHANTHLLVEIAGRPVDLIRPLGWTRGLRIGIFPDDQARTHFLDTLPFDAD